MSIIFVKIKIREKIMKNIIKIFIIILIFSSVCIYSQDNQLPDSIDKDLTIKLVTIGPGADLTSWWGHTAIIVDDKKNGISKFYNFGLFSFEEENFLTNFAMGRLIFWVGAWNTQNALVYYTSLDRDIRIQELNLLKQQSIQIKNILENNIKPENRKYLYDHYYDNCSTRIRDIFDKITNGQLALNTNHPSRMTLREHTRRHTYHNPIMDFILMFLMNDSIDKPILMWNDMFLPSEIETILDSFNFSTGEVENRNFVKRKIQFYKSKGIADLPVRAPIHWPYCLIIGAIVGIFSIVIASIPNVKWRLRKNLYGILTSLIGLTFGFLGSVLFFMSIITDHIVTYYNENLFLVNPLFLIIFVLGILILSGKLKRNHRLYYTWFYLLIISMFGLFLKLFPVFDQDNLQAITLMLPILIGFIISSYIWKNKDHSHIE